MNSTLKNKINKLKERGITEFSVEYSGSGDSGEIHEISYEPKHIQEIEYFSEKWDNKELKMVEKLHSFSIEEFIEEIIYDFLEENYPGWEINDGQSGNFTWHINTMELEHEGYSYYTESIYLEDNINLEDDEED